MSGPAPHERSLFGALTPREPGPPPDWETLKEQAAAAIAATVPAINGL